MLSALSKFKPKMLSILSRLTQKMLFTLSRLDILYHKPYKKEKWRPFLKNKMPCLEQQVWIL